MEIVTIAKELYTKLAINMGAISKNPVLPITEDFLFTIKGNDLTVTSTNLEVTIVNKFQINNTGKKDGSVAIPSNIFLQTLKNLGDMPVTMDFDKNLQMVMTTLTGNYKIPCDKPDDFPSIPDEKLEINVTINSKQLHNGVLKAMVAISDDALRLALTGVLVEFNGDHVCFVGTDAHRLVEYMCPCECDGILDRVIIPRAGIQILKNITEGDEQDVQISFSRKNIKFIVGDITVVSNLIDAKYPEYKAIMRDSSDINSVIDKTDLINSLKRVALYSDGGTRMVSFDFQSDKMKINGVDLMLSKECVEELRCETTGTSLETSISLNNKYLRDMLGVLENEEVSFGMVDSTKPCLIIEQNEISKTTLLLMPIRN